MIGKLTGRVEAASSDGAVVIDVGGVGYCVRVPQGALTHLREGGDASLFIHTAVRDDAIDLFGFPSAEELSFFKQLMSVSGIGPKSALSILNVADVTTLKRGIAKGDAASLTKVFGIGKKSAERIVVELRDKIVIEVNMGPASSAPMGDDGELIEALLALGYSAHESRRAIKNLPSGEGQDVRERLSQALKHLGGNTHRSRA